MIYVCFSQRVQGDPEGLRATSPTRQTDIREAFDHIKSKVDPAATSVMSFINYVEDTWMDSTVWPVESWTVYGRSVRTNNDVEGWHTRLNRRAKKGL